jgi:hypothetical protein
VYSGSPLASAVGARVVKSTTGSGGAIATSVMALVSTGSRTVASFGRVRPPGGIEQVYGKDPSIRSATASVYVHRLSTTRPQGTGLSGTQRDQTGPKVT